MRSIAGRADRGVVAPGPTRFRRSKRTLFRMRSTRTRRPPRMQEIVLEELIAHPPHRPVGVRRRARLGQGDGGDVGAQHDGAVGQALPPRAGWRGCRLPRRSRSRRSRSGSAARSPASPSAGSTSPADQLDLSGVPHEVRLPDPQLVDELVQREAVCRGSGGRRRPGPRTPACFMARAIPASASTCRLGANNMPARSATRARISCLIAGPTRQSASSSEAASAAERNVARSWISTRPSSSLATPGHVVRARSERVRRLDRGLVDQGQLGRPVDAQDHAAGARRGDDEVVGRVEGLGGQPEAGADVQYGEDTAAHVDHPLDDGGGVGQRRDRHRPDQLQHVGEWEGRSSGLPPRRRGSRGTDWGRAGQPSGLGRMEPRGRR